MFKYIISLNFIKHLFICMCTRARMHA